MSDNAINVNMNKTNKAYDYTVSGSSTEAVTSTVYDFFRSQGYKLEKGTHDNGRYGKGSLILRIIFGAVVPRSAFKVQIYASGSNVAVHLEKAAAGGFGGIIGIAKETKTFNDFGSRLQGVLGKSSAGPNNGFASPAARENAVQQNPAAAIAAPSDSNSAVLPILLGALTVLAIIIFAGATHGIFLKGMNIGRLFMQFLFYAIPAFGLILLIKQGHIDFSIGAMFFLSGVIYASFLMAPGIPAVIAFLLAILIAAIIGAAQGLLVGYAKVPSVILTPVTMILLGRLSAAIAKRSMIPLNMDKLKFLFSGRARFTSIIIVLELVFVSAAFLIVYFASKKLKQNNQPEPAGRNPMLITGSFAISGGLAGTAGILFTHYLQAAMPYRSFDYVTLICFFIVFAGGVFISSPLRALLLGLLAALFSGMISNGFSILGSSFVIQQLIIILGAIGFLLFNYFAGRGDNRFYKAVFIVSLVFLGANLLVSFMLPNYRNFRPWMEWITPVVTIIGGIAAFVISRNQIPAQPADSSVTDERDARF